MMELIKQIGYFVASLIVQIPRGFIGQQNAGFSYQRTRQNDTLLFATDSSPARCEVLCANPTSPNRSRAIGAALDCETPRMSSGIMTFSSAVNSGSR